MDTAQQTDQVVEPFHEMDVAMTTEQTITDMIGNAADRLVKVDARLSNLVEHIVGNADACLASDDPVPSLMSTARRFDGHAEDVCNTIGRLSHLLVLPAPVDVKETPAQVRDDLVTVRDVVTHASGRIGDALGGLAAVMARVDGTEPDAASSVPPDTLRGDVGRASDMVERLGVMAELLIASVGTK